MSNYVHDTQDLSTIRGGGLLLLDAIKWIQTRIDGVELEPISTGASSGLFEFIALDDDQAKNVQRKIREWLDSHYALKHATVMVDLIEATDNFLEDKESLIALNRWNQMHSPSLAVPELSDQTIDICAIDRIRPAVNTFISPEQNKEPISTSTLIRRNYGRDKKQNFYTSYTGLEDDGSFKFTNDFNELTGNTDQGNFTSQNGCHLY
ncbi:MAG: hypothetical protein IPM55_18835 [Acidobacteria bacterium]|nr:hypothetical protein [Acidobacteriota bacterium]